MTPWAALVLSVLVAGAWSTHLYWRREPPVPGRALLAGLRALSLGLLAFLVLLPGLRASWFARTAPAWIAIDASRSMAVPGSDDPTTPWARALAEIETAADGADRRVAFGSEPADLTVDEGPDEPSSQLTPLVRRAVEAGAPRLRVYTDLRLSDGADARALAARSGLELDVVDRSVALASAGVAELRAPEWSRAGDSITLEVELFATEAAAGRGARLRFEADGEVLVDRPVTLPAAGAPLRLALDVTAPSRTGPVFWVAHVEMAGDDWAEDDLRHAMTRIDEPEGAVALLSLQPDWEPRVLLEVLREVAGLPTVGWLALADERWLDMSGSGTVSTAEVVRRLQSARVLVLHGVDGPLPDALRPRVDGARRRLIFAYSGDGAAVADIEAEPLQGGEWYPDFSRPSAFGAALEGLDLVTLPPLSGALRVTPDAPAQVAGTPGLLIASDSGERAPVVHLLDDAPQQRTALVTARDFWRWHARPGPAREAYRRLFSGIAGWLLELEPQRSEQAFGPLRSVLAAQTPVAWATGAAGADSPARVEVRWWAEPAGASPAPAPTSAPALDPATDVAPARIDTVPLAAPLVDLPPLPVGAWHWSTRPLGAAGAAAGPTQADSARDASTNPSDLARKGTVVVESASDELRWPRDTLLLQPLPGPDVAADGADPAGIPRFAPPLRTVPWLWLLVIVSLSAEWILRRRLGLR